MTARRVLLVGHATSHEVLTAARDLAEAGWVVHVATGAQRSLAGASRAVRSEHRVTPPDVDLEGFARDVAQTLHDCRAQVVVGCGDPELLALSAVRDRLPATVPLAEHSVVLAAVDKLSLARAAAQVGLAVPRTELADPDTVRTWRGTAVVKPRLHFDPASPASHWVSARVTRSRAQLVHAVREVTAAGGDPVVQQHVRGDLIALSAVRTEDGRLAALMQQRATHTWPPQAGMSSRAVTVPVEPTLAAGVVDLLDHLGWVGMVQVQLLQPEVGPPMLLDLNGRPYGSLPLARAAGLPLLALWLGPGGGLPRSAAVQPAFAQVGVAYSRGGADLKRAVTERRNGLMQDLSSTCWAWRGAAHPVADRNDARPLLRLVGLGARGVRGTVRRRASGLLRLAHRGRPRRLSAISGSGRHA